MTADRPRVGLACSEAIYRSYIDTVDIERLEKVADFSYQPWDVGGRRFHPVPRDPAAEAELARFASDLDVLVLGHGSPFVSAELLDGTSRLSLIGELEGDRCGYHVSMDAAAAYGVRVVDTTHGSSWPTAEWALALALVGVRNAGACFRRISAHQQVLQPRSAPSNERAELSGKRVGMIGFGHLARRLTELLRPFQVDIVAFDPFVPRELATAYGVALGPLSVAMDRDIVFCLAALTPGTARMIGAEQISLLRPGSVFVNVSRGEVVDSGALVARLREGDIVACLDVFDPEPVPVDSPITDLPNVFLSPHLGGSTEESRRRFFHLMVSEILRHLDGVEPLSELTSDIVRLRTTGKPGTLP
jgi:phosphoglycerate dehydrogenase-like enzyme